MPSRRTGVAWLWNSPRRAPVSNLAGMRNGVPLSLFLLLTLVLLFAPAALAATTPGGGGNADVTAANVPAVEAPPEAVEDDEHPWTTRFLAPIVLLIGAVAIGGSTLYYAVRIRGRYRVADRLR